jgi:hypothetical protein
MGKKVSQQLIICDNDDTQCKDPGKLADMFILFFVGKTEALELVLAFQYYHIHRHIT